MRFENVYFINGTAYAGKSTMVKLLAQKYDGIACEENYHDRLLPGLDPAEFPCLCYTRDLTDWHDFIRRTPEEYEAWFDGVTKECETLELRILPDLASQGKPVFVDTNICPETLKTVSDRQHVLIMLADPQISVRRFFERSSFCIASSWKNRTRKLQWKTIGGVSCGSIRRNAMTAFCIPGSK